jgi:hypothetical protein
MKKPTPPKLSRRHLIGGAAMAPLIGASTGKPLSRTTPLPAPAPAIDPVVEMAQECLALHRESERLHRRCGTVEEWLVDHHNWFKLSKAQRRALPEGCKLQDIKDRLDFLWKERPRKMRRMRNTRATSLEGAIGKLRCVAGGMEPDEFPGTFKLLQATIRDLEAMRI